MVENDAVLICCDLMVPYGIIEKTGHHCHRQLPVTKPLPAPMLTYGQFDPWEQMSFKLNLKKEDTTFIQEN